MTSELEQINQWSDTEESSFISECINTLQRFIVPSDTPNMTRGTEFCGRKIYYFYGGYSHYLYNLHSVVELSDFSKGKV